MQEHTGMDEHATEGRAAGGPGLRRGERQPRILSIDGLLGMRLVIPDYQRPYKWTARNVTELITDIGRGIDRSRRYAGFRYRVGTVILHENEAGEYEIVDGQQRILSLLLLKLYLEPGVRCALLETGFADKVSQRNLHDNYMAVREWFSSVDDDAKGTFNRAMGEMLEVVVITVGRIDEAFQLFDSQNTRGRALYPHDLLKAYHLREIHDRYEMQSAVVKWESKRPEAIRELFDLYLYPLWNWARCRRCGRFTAGAIDVYKGIEESSGYTYARRANKAMPYFLLTEPFISGGDFFGMVDHYMLMLRNIKEEIVTNESFAAIRDIVAGGRAVSSAEELDRVPRSALSGLAYARNLFFCALLCYYDRFHNFDVMAVRKLFTWAMMVRVDMQMLGFDTINRYAIGAADGDRYSNAVPVISMIAYARKHTEISGLRLSMRADGVAASEKWNDLYSQLLRMNGYE